MRATTPLRAAAITALLFASTAALAADRVAVLRFSPAGGETTPTQADSARESAMKAVELLHDSMPSAAEMAAGEAAVPDRLPDSTGEYRAAGVASGANWTIVGHVTSHGWTYRLELEVCQVASGRVESLVREVDGRQPAQQIAEMLTLLLRPEGVSDAVPSWEPTRGVGPVLQLPQAPALTPSPAPPPAPPPPLGSVYGAERPFGAGLGVEVLGAFVRAGGAHGGAVAGVLTAHLAAALASIPGFELIADGSADVIGPTSMSFDLGARYVVPATSTGALFIGPEVAFGAFFPLGGDKDARLLSRGEIVFVIPVRTNVFIEAYPEVAFAAGGTGSLVFAGAGARAVLRF